MKRKPLSSLAMIGGAAAMTLLVLVLFGRGDSAVAQGPVAAREPDTNWKLISDDLGVMIRNDEALGLRARLYVRRNGLWLPVATDGPGDTVGAVPIK